MCNRARGCAQCAVQIFIAVSVNMTHVALHAPTVMLEGLRESKKIIRESFNKIFKLLSALVMAGELHELSPAVQLQWRKMLPTLI